MSSAAASVEKPTAIWVEGDTSVGSVDPHTGFFTIRATGGRFEWVPDPDQSIANSIAQRSLISQSTQPRDKLLREPFARTANLLENLDPTSACGKFLGPNALAALDSLAGIIILGGEPQSRTVIRQNYTITQRVMGPGNLPIYRVPSTPCPLPEGG